MTGRPFELIKNAPVAPCMNCPDRTAECHGVCEKYKEYEQARREVYEEARKAREMNQIIYEGSPSFHSYRRARDMRAKRGRRKK